jgi:hypothetical protein
MRALTESRRKALPRSSLDEVFRRMNLISRYARYLLNPGLIAQTRTLGSFLGVQVGLLTVDIHCCFDTSQIDSLEASESSGEL